VNTGVTFSNPATATLTVLSGMDFQLTSGGGKTLTNIGKIVNDGTVTNNGGIIIDGGTSPLSLLVILI
jgi:hypothetical protein